MISERLFTFTARFNSDFESWRSEAREFIRGNIQPESIYWLSSDERQENLFSGRVKGQSEERVFSTSRADQKIISVPARFVKAARFVAAHRDPHRWELLYKLLWRMTHGEPDLLDLSIDLEVARFDSMLHSVRRDLHKMTAFVRFRKIKTEGESAFVAWYEPDHPILKLAVDFFAKRFNGMVWSILTPDSSAHWDGERLHFTGGGKRADLPAEDAAEDLWRTYYSSIFNPARIKVRAMKKELPVRYWKNLPESRLISDLIRKAPSRLQQFYAQQPESAEPYLALARVGGEPPTLASLREASALCRACGICEHATQTVFGEGPDDAEIVIVGEQPGDQEDLSGRPFVGPAGHLLNQALADAGLDRGRLYLTNAVKHFKWKRQGTFRLHQRPSASEISVCKPWLNAELEIMRPKTLVCLGNSAAQSVLGKAVTLKEVRGRWLETAACPRTLVTIHPSAILRIEDGSLRKEEYLRFVADLSQTLESLPI